MIAERQNDAPAPLPRQRTVAAPDPLLRQLRRVARKARCKSHVDMFEASAALSMDRHAAADAACEVLVRCLSQALGRRPVLLSEQAMDTSFDEDWLMALARGLASGDNASALFLLHSRVPRHARRTLVFLLRSATRQAYQV